MYFEISYVVFLLSCLLSHQLVKKLRRRASRIVLVGPKEEYSNFVEYLFDSNLELNVVGYIFNGEKPDRAEEYLGNIRNLESIIHKLAIDQVWFMVGEDSSSAYEYEDYIERCIEMGITVRSVVGTGLPHRVHTYTENLGIYPIVTYHTISLNKGAQIIKRTLDLLGSLAGIILFSPIILLTMAAIKLDSKGPVFFKQERVGMNGRKFYIYKFRSMRTDAEEMKEELAKFNQVEGGFMFKIKDDPRITRVGKFIRKTSIDEIPQFFNVFLGSMSLVGTRPPTVDEVGKYKRRHWRRLSIKPGITGMWQINGRNTIKDFDEIVGLDTQYIDQWSIFLDIKILFRTVFVLFGKKDAF